MRTRVAVLAFAICLALFPSASTVWAYSTDGQRFVSNVNYCYYTSAVPDSWSSSGALGNARGAWNRAGSPLRIYYASGSASYVTCNNRGNTGSLARAWHTTHPSAHSPKLHSGAAIEFNSYYSWSTTGARGKYDVQNVATHEFGHWVFLNDLSGSSNADKTMYGSIGTGETKKRSLHSDDIAGVNYLY